MTQIEAILNSRPFTSVSNDANDALAITPGQFLIGRPITALPELKTTGKEATLLTRQKKRLENFIRDLWKKWSAEFLSNWQQRKKWQTGQTNIDINDVVITKEENTPPTLWPIGRITKVKDLWWKWWNSSSCWTEDIIWTNFTSSQQFCFVIERRYWHAVSTIWQGRWHRCRMNNRGYRRGKTARKCELQLYKTGKQELIDFKKVSINFGWVSEKYYVTQLTTKPKDQFLWYISKVEPFQGGRYVSIYNDLWYNELQCNPSKMRRTMINNRVLKPNAHNFEPYYYIHLVSWSLRFLWTKRYKAFLSKWSN